jgi:hypothetical protein
VGASSFHSSSESFAAGLLLVVAGTQKKKKKPGAAAAATQTQRRNEEARALARMSINRFDCVVFELLVVFLPFFFSLVGAHAYRKLTFSGVGAHAFRSDYGGTGKTYEWRRYIPAATPC